MFFLWIDMMESNGSRECQGVMVGSADHSFDFLISISIDFSGGKKFFMTYFAKFHQVSNKLSL